MITKLLREIDQLEIFLIQMISKPIKISLTRKNSYFMVHTVGLFHFISNIFSESSILNCVFFFVHSHSMNWQSQILTSRCIFTIHMIYYIFRTRIFNIYGPISTGDGSEIDCIIKLYKNLPVLEVDITSFVKASCSDHDVCNGIRIAIGWWSSIFQVTFYLFTTLVLKLVVA